MKPFAKMALLLGVIGYGFFQYLYLWDCWRLGGEYDLLRCHCSITLVYMAKDGDLAGVLKELDRGTPINDIDSLSFTGLAWAARMGEIEAAKLLLNKGANPNTIDVYGGTPLIYAVTSCESTELLKLLVVRGANLEVKDPDGATALSIAARVANADAVEILLDSGANAKTRDKNGRTPLQIAQMKVKELGKIRITPDPRMNYLKIIRLLSKAKAAK